MNCYACRVQSERREPAIAFLAGIGFAFEFTNEAMEARLCAFHQDILVHAVKGARPSVPAHERRSTEEKT